MLKPSSIVSVSVCLLWIGWILCSLFVCFSESCDVVVGQDRLGGVLFARVLVTERPAAVRAQDLVLLLRHIRGVVALVARCAHVLFDAVVGAASI